MAKDRELKVRLTGDVADLERKLQTATKRTDDFAAAVNRAAREQRQAGRDQDAFADSAGRTDRAVGRLNMSLGDTADKLGKVKDSLNTIKSPALIAGVGLATQAIGALGAGAAATAASLSTVAGAYAAMPALVSAQKQAMGTLKLATDGVTEALGGLNDKLDEDKLAKLTPEARAFVRALDDMKPRVRDLQRDLQAGLFDGVTDGLKDADRAFGVLEQRLPHTAEVLAQLSRQAGELVGSKSFGRDLDRQLQRNDVTIARLGRSGLHLADALRHVVIEAGPLVGWMTKSVEQGAKQVDVWAKQARASGDMAQFFGETKDTMKTLASIGGNVAETLWEIGKAAKPLGDDLLGSLDQASQRMADWSQSAGGRNELRQYFEDARPAIYAAADLVESVGGAFLRLSRGDQVAPLIRQLDQELLPVLESVLGTTTEALGPVLITAGTELAKVFGHLAGSSGPLVTFVEVLGEGAKTVNWLLDNLPGLNEAVVTLAAAGGISKALGLGASITGVKRLNELLRTTGDRTAAITAIPGGGGGRGGAGGGGGGVTVLPGGGVMPARRGRRPAQAVAEGPLTRPARGYELQAGARGWEMAPQPGVRGAAARGLSSGVGLAARGASATAGLFGGPVGMAVAAGLIFGPEIAKAFADSEKASEKQSKAYKKIEEQARNATGSTKEYVAQLRHRANEEDKAWQLGPRNDEAERQHRLAEALRDTARAAEQSAPGFRRFGAEIDRVAGSFDDVAKVGKSQLQSLKTNVELNMRAIARTVGRNSAEGREAFADNFNAAAVAIKRAMDRGALSTKEGTQLMNRYIRRALSEFGIDGKEADRYMEGQDTKTGVSIGAGGRIPGTQQARGAATGFIGRPGARGHDLIPLVVGEGEAVVNGPQQQYVDFALQTTFGHGFDDLFNRVTTPHYAAAAGGHASPFAAARGKSPDAIVALGRDLQRRGYQVGEHPAFGGVQGRHAPGGWHYKDGALDVNADGRPGGEPAWLDRLNAELVRRGWHTLWRVAGHFDHLHVDIGGGAGRALGPGGGGAPKVRRAKFPAGMGALSLLGQAGLDALRAGGQSVVDRAAASAIGPIETGGQGGGRSSAGGQLNKQQLARLWVQAGGPPSVANLMAAIALAESGGNPGATGPLTSYGHRAAGLWQIHPPQPGSYEPLTNARQAVAKYRSQGLGAWEAYTRGMHRKYMARGGYAARGRKPGRGSVAHTAATANARAQAAAAATQSQSRTARGANRQTGQAQGAQASAVAAAAAARAESMLQKLGLDAALAQLTDTPDDDIAAARGLVAHWEQQLVAARTTADRTTAANALVSARADLTRLTAPADTPPAPTPGLLDDEAAGELAHLETHLALSQVDTPDDTADDLAWSKGVQGFWERRLAARRAAGASGEELTQLAGNVLSARQAAAGLDTQRQSEEQSRRELTEALKALADETKRQNDFAESVSKVTGAQALRALADIVSGQMVGANYNGRALTASAGSVVRL
jgi:hypothetical protein